MSVYNIEYIMQVSTIRTKLDNTSETRLSNNLITIRKTNSRHDDKCGACDVVRFSLNSIISEFIVQSRCTPRS
jgi:hypothetical protein